jgi:hypothetical protein
MALKRNKTAKLVRKERKKLESRLKTFTPRHKVYSNRKLNKELKAKHNLKSTGW